ncbi:MAG: acyltransferase family protein [Robiginitomaculum sp.]|nr:acyltransferase family protein [Robiginitomaculum sp.]
MDILQTRRYDLDWLRILAFGLLIFYHIGMFYVSWDFHVKSVHAGPFAEPLMKLLNPWRLSLLFFISGVAIRFASDKHPNIIRFTWQRTLHLFIPIVFGIHIIVAPQAYLQLLENGEITQGFWQFYPDYLKGSTSKYSIILPTWNHLWYVVYLMIYTLLVAPFFRPLSKFMCGKGARLTQKLFAGKRGVLTLTVLGTLPFMIYRFWLKPIYPSTHAFVGDWANHQLYIMIFLLGFLLAKDKAFWNVVKRALKPTLWAIFFIVMTAILVWNFDFKHSGNTSLQLVEFFEERTRKTLYAWLCILAFLGLAQKYLNRPSRALTYMTEAIFPWYILHQTIIIMAGYSLTRQGLSVGVEFILVTLATIAGCAIGNEFLIRRWTWIRPLFGLKRNALKP